MKVYKGLFLLAALIAFTSAVALADDVTWTLNNVTFNDGGTASGTFTYDADTQTVDNWNLTTTSGSILGGSNYDPGDSSYFIQNLGNPQDSIIFEIGQLQLRITPISALTDAGGNVAINLNTANGESGGVECFNCSPFRIFVSGDLSAATVNETPEPASIFFLGSGLLGLAGGVRRRFFTA